LAWFPWKQRGYYQFVIGAPIIHIFERQGEKIHGRDRGTKKGARSPRGGDLLAFKYATF